MGSEGLLSSWGLPAIANLVGDKYVILHMQALSNFSKVVYVPLRGEFASMTFFFLDSQKKKIQTTVIVGMMSIQK